MLRSLMSGVAGLKAYQTKMDVIGNNIANVNTVGFKSSSVNFSDIFYQKTQSASSATTTKAGTNAKQIGYGSSVASIATTTATQGGSQTTNRALDLMINGNAFFIVQMDGQNYFTKNGSFDIDGLGNLSSESGGLVMGWGVDETTGEIVQDAVSPIKLYSPENETAEPDATTDVYFQGNIDFKDPSLELGKTIQMDFYDNLGNQYAAKFKVVSEGAPDSNEYSVILTDVVDSDENSIFVNTKTNAGVTTYTPREGVTIDFAGYTYELEKVDKVTGEVTLKSYEIGPTGVRKPTEGDVPIPEDIVYNPTYEEATDTWEGALYKLEGNAFVPIKKDEIDLYVEVSSDGILSINNTATDRVGDLIYTLDDTTNEMVPITGPKSIKEYEIDTTMPFDKIDATEAPYFYDPVKKEFIAMVGNLNEWKNTDGAFTWSDLNANADGAFSVAVKDAQGNNYMIKDANGTDQQLTVKQLYYKNGDDFFLITPPSTDANATTVTWGETFHPTTGIDGIISGTPRASETKEVNKGAEIVFNASTGKFATVSGQSARYDENNNLITNNVTFKVYTSTARAETSAKNLFEEITMDFSSLTMYADGGTSTVSGIRGNLETGLGAGWASGVLTGVSVGNDGKIYGDYDNGVKKLLGQIAVTSFANPTGLEALGNSLFKTTVNSGEFDGVGSDIYTLGLSITSGALESSNVDLSNEFTNMITTQRGFEANSKIITTSDSMLDTLINLKR